MLARGGSALDAAVAAAATIAVVYPHMNGVGGDNFWLVYDARNDRLTALNAHTLIPSMFLVDGRPRLVYGTMGGEGQPQTQAALVTRTLDRDLTPQEAVEAPRWLFGRTWGEPSRALRIEDRFGLEVAQSLVRRGHDVRVVEPFSDLMGHAQLIAIDGMHLTAASDPRADGAARAL